MLIPTILYTVLQKQRWQETTESMALELSTYGIRVNCIAPGATAIRDEAKANEFYTYLGDKILWAGWGHPRILVMR